MLSKRVFRYIISALVLFILSFYPIVESFAQWGKYEGWHMGPGMMGWFGGIFMIVFWVLILAGLVLAIRWLVQATSKKGVKSQGGSRAIEILKERYARGEIDKTQFEAMRRDLADESYR